MGSASTHPVWPTGVDYSRAVQCRDDRLGAEFDYAEGLLGSPQTAHGRHAIVFRFDDRTGARVALRCFTSAQPDAERRYREFDHHLRRHPVDAFPSVEWMDEAIEVNGETWPALRMEWIDGVRLDRWIDGRVTAGDADALTRMADRWRRACLDVAAAGIGHGDYQHGNVLIDADDRIRFVDLDGMWVPALADAPADECGHEAYQHPHRSRHGHWSEDVDGFSALVIWLSLRAVAADPSLWSERDPHDEHLVLDERDLADLSRPLWARLTNSSDDEVVALAERLRTLVRAPVAALPGVDRTLTDPAEALDLPVAAEPGTNAPAPDREVDRPTGRHRDGPAVLATRVRRRPRAAALVALVVAVILGASAAVAGSPGSSESGAGDPFELGGGDDSPVPATSDAPESEAGDASDPPPPSSDGETRDDQVGDASEAGDPDPGDSGDAAEDDDGATGPGDESLPGDHDGAGSDIPPHLRGNGERPGSSTTTSTSTTTTARPPERRDPPKPKPSDSSTTTTSTSTSTTSTSTTTTTTSTTTTSTTTTTTTAPPRPPLDARISASATQVDTGVAITFDAGGSAGDPTGFTWDWGYAGRTSTGRTVTYAWPEPGTYRVTLTVTRGDETDTATFSVLVTSPGAVVPNIVGLTHTQAIQALESVGLGHTAYPVRNAGAARFTVVDQFLPVGVSVPVGTDVVFYVADIPYCDDHPDLWSCGF